MTARLLVAADFIQTGGMDVANYALARHLADSGDEVHLVGHSAEPALLSHRNVIFHCVAKPAGSYLLGEPLLSRMGRAIAAKLAKRRGTVVVNGGNCEWGDVNWVHYVHAAYRPSPCGNTLVRAKWSLSHRVFLRHERVAIGRARVVIANSDVTKQDLVERLGVKSERVHTVYYGIDPERFRPAANGERESVRRELGVSGDVPVVAFVGALGDRRKGFDTAFEAWREFVGDSRRQGLLLVIGAGAELETWKQRAVAAGLSQSIRFLGRRSDVPALLRGCDALVAPTRYEAYGLGVREALCCGLPAFVTRTAGVAETYPPALADLLLRDPDDARDLAARLARWRASMAAYREMVAEFSKELRAHTWAKMSSQITELMDCA